MNISTVVKRFRILGVAMSASLCLTACGGASQEVSGGNSSEELVVRLNYTPWAMHNYLYAAVDQGYFEDVGLNVEVKPAQPGQSLQFVGTGREEIGITDATAMLSAIEAGAPVEAIAMDHPISPAAFFFLESSGIEDATDLVGKKICYPTGSNAHEALVSGLKKQGIDPQKIEMTSISPGSEVSLVPSGECDASEGFTYGQPLTLEAEGHEAEAISVGELGIDLYGVVIFANKEVVAERGDDLEKFMEALGRAQMWTYKNLPQATRNTLKRTEGRTVPNEMDKAKIIYGDYRQNDEFNERWGEMTEASWSSTITALTDIGALEGEIDATEVFTNEFVEHTESTARFARLLRNNEPVS